MSTRSRRLAAVMFTDMVGYSSLVQADEAAALALLERHNQFVRLIVPKYRGREVKTVGDAFLLEFGSALDATRCAIELQQLLHDYNETAPEGWAIRIRIGIHVGDIVDAEGDVLGDAVNIASRVQSLAEAGGICLTQQVFDQVQNKLTTPLERLPPHSLKNISQQVTTYRVVPAWESRRRSAAVAPARRGRNLAVLPLTNISPDARDEYFADGLTEELITSLSQVRDLSVIARTSVLQYKAAPKPIAQVAAELGVDTVLEGSVRKAGNRVRITLQLVNPATQAHIWANTYNREVEDVFEVQSDIAQRTADALRLELGPPGEPPSVKRPTSDPAAYDLYLRGLATSRSDDPSYPDGAFESFAQATRVDPRFAEAYASWANLYVTVAGDRRPFSEAMPRARELVEKALALDPESSAAHSALANILFQADQNWTRAEAEFNRALELNPSNVVAYRFKGLMLIALQRYSDAKDALREAIRLDPGGGHRSTLAWIEMLNGEPGTALEEAANQLATDPKSIRAHIGAGILYATLGRKDDAAREADFPMTGAPPDAIFDHALLTALIGRPQEAREFIARGRRDPTSGLYVSASDLSLLHGALGENDRALDLLEEDFQRGERMLWIWYRGPWYDGMRNEPRFVSLLEKYGVPARTGPPAVRLPS